MSQVEMREAKGDALAGCARREAIGLAEREARTPKGPQGPAPHLPTIGVPSMASDAYYLPSQFQRGGYSSRRWRSVFAK